MQSFNTSSELSRSLAIVFAAIFLLAPFAHAQVLLDPVEVGPVQPLVEVPWQSLFGAAEPITERVGVSGDDFVVGDDNVLRIFGTSLFGEAVFVDSLRAIAIAQHLSALGFNSVRITGHDFTWNPALSIFKPIEESQMTELDEASMRRLDWLFYQLKQHGIYVHLPLHQQRQAFPEDGVDGWLQQPGQLRVAKFIDPQIEELDKRVARAILEHVNPFTEMAYKDDPGLGWVDVTEDKSLFNFWSAGFLSNPDIIGEYYVTMMQTRWQEYLKEKYANDAELNSAWSQTATSNENLVSGADFEDPFAVEWQLFNVEGSQVVADAFSNDAASGEYAMRLRVNSGGAQLGDVQLRNTSAPLIKNQKYLMRFFAKSEPAGKQIAAHLMNPAAPFQHYGVNVVPFTLTDEWTEYTLEFRANDDNDLGALLIFFAGGSDADLLIDDVSINMISEAGLAEGESLDGFIAQTTADQITLAPLARAREYIQFLSQLMKGHYDRMREFVQQDIGSDVLVGSPTIPTFANDIYAQSDLDYTAMANGWDFIRQTGDGGWTIQNLSSIDVPWGGLAALCARGAMIDKPNVISRMLMPYPSAHQHEMASVWPAYAAYQDWDAYYVSSFASSLASISGDIIPQGDYYSFGALPHVTAMIPAAAAAFRRGMIAEARETIAIQQTEEALYYTPLQTGVYWLESLNDARLPLFRRVGIERFDADFQTRSPQTDIFELSNGDVNTSDMRSDTDEIVWNADDSYLTVNTAMYKSVAGRFGGELIEQDEWSVLRLDEGTAGAVTLISMDEDAEIKDAEKLFLTIATRALNRGAVWNAENTSIQAGWGEGPIEMEPMRVELVLESERDSMLIVPLNQAGMPLEGVEPITLTNTGGFFRWTADQSETAAFWYTIELRDEVVSTDVTRSVTSKNAPGIELMSEHPATGIAMLKLEIPQNGSYEFQVLTMQGARQAAFSGQSSSGSVIKRLDTRSMAPGVYVLQLSTPSGIATESIVVHR